MELQKLKAEIEAIKEELDKLIDSGADFEEIYETSTRLDELIVIFQKSLCRSGLQ